MGFRFKALVLARPTNKIRIVTAASLVDGHDAAINVFGGGTILPHGIEGFRQSW